MQTTIAKEKKETAAWAKKVLAAGALAAAMLAASVFTGSPAHAATTFTVNSQQGDESDASSADGLCKTSRGECTLRAAIQQANFTPGADTINFNSPGGVSLRPTAPMPVISDTVTIDGYTQPGTHPNTLAKGDDAVLAVDLLGENIAGGSGLDIRADNTVVRGLLIGEFEGNGVSIFGNGNKIEGNFIGTEPIGIPDVGNGHEGVAVVNGSNNTIGGTSPAARNVISANDDNGVLISGSQNNKVLGNLIGTEENGTTALGNSNVGVFIHSGSNNTIGDGTSGGGNTIAFNGGEGVSVNDTNNRVLSNSIFFNAGLGIDLNGDGVTPNDPGDADTGSNGLQNFPVISSAKNTSTATTISAKLNSETNTSYIVQFFSNSSGNEGKKFIGQKTVLTDASGNVSFTFKPSSKVAAGQSVTATATRNFFNIPSSTSEFSAAKKVLAS